MALITTQIPVGSVYHVYYWIQHQLVSINVSDKLYLLAYLGEIVCFAAYVGSSP